MHISGLCWDDLVVRQKGKDSALVADTGRGLGWDVDLLEAMLGLVASENATLRGVIRGHQHNDVFGPMLTRLINGVCVYGFVH